jgi:hypothetical protein
VGPERRFGVTLFVSLALWFPTLQELLANNVTLASALLHYAVGLGVAWFAVAVVDRLLSGYRATNVARRRMAPLRRASDHVPELGEPLPLDAPHDDAD